MCIKSAGAQINIPKVHHTSPSCLGPGPSSATALWHFPGDWNITNFRPSLDCESSSFINDDVFFIFTLFCFVILSFSKTVTNTWTKTVRRQFPACLPQCGAMSVPLVHAENFCKAEINFIMRPSAFSTKVAGGGVSCGRAHNRVSPLFTGAINPPSFSFSVSGARRRGS